LACISEILLQFLCFVLNSVIFDCLRGRCNCLYLINSLAHVLKENFFNYFNVLIKICLLLSLS
jgi:hypothetical protein